MQRRLTLYFVTLTLAAFAAVLLVFAIAGGFSSVKREVAKGLDIQLSNSTTAIESRIEKLAAEGLSLSRQLSRIMDSYFLHIDEPFSALNDDPDALLDVQRAAFEPLYSYLQIADCNGVYFILNSSANTSAAAEKPSRSGTYLRFSSVKINIGEKANAQLFRGNPAIARGHGIELHNTWELETSPDCMPHFDAIMEMQLENMTSAYTWTEKFSLPGSWEYVILLGVPVVGHDGTVYGVCGFEINELLFRFSYPVVYTEFGPMITVLAPRTSGELQTGSGLVGGLSSYLSGVKSLSVKDEGLFLGYVSNGLNYVGNDVAIKLSPHYMGGNREWAVAVLLPQEYYDAYYLETQTVWIVLTSVFLLVLLIVSGLLSKHYVRPIISAISTIDTSGLDGAAKTNILEIDALIERLKDIGKPDSPLPDDFFSEFIALVKTLTPNETEVFLHYVDGKSVKEITSQMFISENTLRKHNTSIFRKMGVASWGTLTAYADIMKRCGHPIENVLYNRKTRT